MPWERALTRLAPWLRGMESGLEGRWFPLAYGDEQASFVYAGEPDVTGELPVLTLDARDLVVFLAAPGFDVWLALQHDLFDEVPAAHAARMRWHARHNLGGDAILRLRERDVRTKERRPVASPEKPPAPKAPATKRGLSDETKAAIAALAQRRKGDVLLAAIELAKKLEGKLDDATARAVARELGRKPDEGLVLADLLRVAPGAIRKNKRLAR